LQKHAGATLQRRPKCVVSVTARNHLGLIDKGLMEDEKQKGVDAGDWAAVALKRLTHVSFNLNESGVSDYFFESIMKSEEISI
jgi:hypothetical protein